MQLDKTSSARVQREVDLDAWAREQLAARSIRLPAGPILRTVSDDASFRRYFRIVHGDESFIFVDSPPDTEDNTSFVSIAGYLLQAELNVPVVYGVDFDQGFMMLSDLGDEHYLTAPTGANQATLYRDLLKPLQRMQTIKAPLPHYDRAKLTDEMNLFTDWFVSELLSLDLERSEAKELTGVFEALVESALVQPSVFVHRDFHSRNLMTGTSPGILDFQDAVLGPVTYDLVSLLRDCYIQLPTSLVDELVEEYRQLLGKTGISATADEFRRWFDLMGLQRHIKCAGIFSRLHLRDGKPGYLGDIPLVITYIQSVSSRYPELLAFSSWLKLRIEPLMGAELFKR